jgi:multicomponent Na+:H+ antiporter subunit D
LHRLGSVNETWLHGRARHLRITGVLFTLAGLGLADLPPFGTFLGKGWIETTGGSHGMTWLVAVFILCTILAGGAVLRVAGGVFYGLGDPPTEDQRMAREANEETSETDAGRQHTPLTMLIPPAVLIAVAIAIGLTPLGPAVEAAAVRFQDQAAYIATVLHGAHVAHPVSLFHAEATGIAVSDVVTGLVSAVGAAGLAYIALYWRRLPVLRRGYEPGAGLTTFAEGFQSGVINDYVTWLVLGLACLGGVLTLIIC